MLQVTRASCKWLYNEQQQYCGNTGAIGHSGVTSVGVKCRISSRDTQIQTQTEATHGKAGGRVAALFSLN